MVVFQTLSTLINAPLSEWHTWHILSMPQRQCTYKMKSKIVYHIAIHPIMINGFFKGISSPTSPKASQYDHKNLRMPWFENLTITQQLDQASDHCVLNLTTL